MTLLKHHSKAEFGTVNAQYNDAPNEISDIYLLNDGPLVVFQSFLNKIVT